jgi:Spy/CpxP family protein refolding chaperone
LSHKVTKLTKKIKLCALRDFVGYFLPALNFCLKKISMIQNMKHMKISLVVFSLSLITISASAQIERKPLLTTADSARAMSVDKNADKQSRKDRLKELNLTREQKGKLKELHQSGKAAKAAIENNTQLSAAEKKIQMRELQKAQAEKMQAILTPEQREKFKASIENNP